MKKESDELTDLFRFRLGESEMKVREGFWENLEMNVPVVISRRRQLIFRLTAAASVLLVLAGASAALWYFSPNDEIASAFTQVAVTSGTSGQLNADIVHQEFPVVQNSPVSPVPSSLKPVAEIENHPLEEPFSISFSMSFSFSSSASSTPDRYDTNSANYNRASSLSAQSDNDQRQTAFPSDDRSSQSPQAKQRKWSVGVHASAGLLNDHIHTRDMKPFVSNDMTTGFTSGTISHKLPFSAGISVRRELSDRWGIESGLTYSQLNSDLTASGEDVYYNQNQTLHYIGIPVKADYSLYRNNRMTLYASSGGMIEKCVSGKVETGYYENNRKTKSSGRSNKADQLQISLTAAIGLQYRISDRLSLYAEPGLSYHFDDGSSVASIRKEKPLNINLLCGVRMTY